MSENMNERSLAAVYPHLAREWDMESNGELTPEKVLPGSHKVVWWRCGKGHSYQATVNSRTRGTGCPVCAGRKTQAGENDLAAQYPQIAAEWDSELNGNLTPEDITAGSKRRVWWRCEKGHRWQAQVVSRTAKGSGCPYCAGKIVIPGETDLASRYPQIAREWNHSKNGGLKPEEVAPQSGRKVWWICPRGHEYQAAVKARVMSKSGCPYCSWRKVLAGYNDLATVYPKIAAEWDYELNGTLTPEMVTAGTRRKVWWRCWEGHVWKAAVYSRTGSKKCGCPICAGRRK